MNNIFALKKNYNNKDLIGITLSILSLLMLVIILLNVFNQYMDWWSDSLKMIKHSYFDISIISAGMFILHCIILY